MRLLPLVVLAVSPLLRAQELPAIEVHEVAGANLRYAVQLPPEWQPAKWVPLLVTYARGEGGDEAVAAVARLGPALSAAGFVVVCPVHAANATDLGPLFAQLRRTFRIEQGGMHALVPGGEGILPLLAQRHQFQTVTFDGPIGGAKDRLVQGAPARRVGIFQNAAHFPRLHAERVLPGAAGEVARVLDDFHDAAANGDEDRYFAIFPDDGVFLGTDGTERWMGAQFREFAMPYFQGDSAWTYVCLRRAVDVDAGGQWATFDETLDNEAYGECRGSGVLVKRGDRWVLRQYHLTIPVPNDLARGVASRIRAFQGGNEPATTTIVIVRHGEKVDGSADAELNDAGRARADALSMALRDVRFQAVYTSQFRRTAGTVAPLCAAKALEPQVVLAGDAKALVERVTKENLGQHVLVCGHSNTVPEILMELGVHRAVTIGDDEYDRLFVVTLDADGRGARMLSLRYGSP